MFQNIFIISRHQHPRHLSWIPLPHYHIVNMDDWHNAARTGCDERFFHTGQLVQPQRAESHPQPPPPRRADDHRPRDAEEDAALGGVNYSALSGGTDACQSRSRSVLRLHSSQQTLLVPLRTEDVEKITRHPLQYPSILHQQRLEDSLLCNVFPFPVAGGDERR